MNKLPAEIILDIMIQLNSQQLYNLILSTKVFLYIFNNHKDYITARILWNDYINHNDNDNKQIKFSRLQNLNRIYIFNYFISKNVDKFVFNTLNVNNSSCLIGLNSTAKDWFLNDIIIESFKYKYYDCIWEYTKQIKSISIDVLNSILYHNYIDIFKKLNIDDNNKNYILEIVVRRLEIEPLIYLLNNYNYSDLSFIKILLFDSYSEHKFEKSKLKLDLIKCIIKKIDIRFKNHILLWSARYCFLEIIHYLIENGADINACKEDILYISVEHGHLEIVKFILQYRIEDKYINKAFCSSAEHGHLEIVKFLLHKGAKIHFDNDYALLHSVKNNHYQIVKFLLENGAKNINKAFLWSKKYKANSNIAKLFLKYIDEKILDKIKNSKLKEHYFDCRDQTEDLV